MADKHIFNWTLESIIHQSPPRTDHLTRSSKDSDESMITHSCREIEAQAQRSEGTTEDTCTYSTSNDESNKTDEQKWGSK